VLSKWRKYHFLEVSRKDPRRSFRAAYAKLRTTARLNCFERGKAKRRKTPHKSVSSLSRWGDLPLDIDCVFFCSKKEDRREGGGLLAVLHPMPRISVGKVRGGAHIKKSPLMEGAAVKRASTFTSAGRKMVYLSIRLRNILLHQKKTRGKKGGVMGT